MDYKKNYSGLIYHAKKQNRKLGDGNYYEVHHILPRSLGGKDTEENLVLLTAREHYLAHFLLWKFTTGEDKKKMLHAFRLMSLCGDYYVFSSRAFEKAKNEFRNIINKPVICLETLQVFPSLREAAYWLITETKTNSKQITVEKNISNLLKSGRKTCCGYSFDYFEENKKYEKREKKNNKQFFENKKKIICLQTLKVYNSARDAEKDTGVSFKSISRSCIYNTSTKGLNFNFFDETKKYEKKEMQKLHKQSNLKIKCIETGEIFDSLQKLSKIIGVSRSTVSYSIKQKKECKGFHYEKIEE